MKKYLIINADDFGLTPGVNNGIIHAFVGGVVSSTSIMVNMPGFADAVQWTRKHPGLGVGMHFNLTYGKPISSPKHVPSLVDLHGCFSRGAKSWTFNDVTRELTAQWETLTRAGIHPTHLDSHHHIQRYSVVRSAMVSLASIMQIPMRRLAPDDPDSNYLSTDFLIADTYSKPDGLHQLLVHLQNLKPGVTELVCHPGYVDDLLLKTSSWTHVREQELRVFLDPQVKRALQQHEIYLIHYGMLNAFMGR